METLGVLILCAAAWLMYAGTKGIDPIRVGFQILTHAQDAQSILQKANSDAASQYSALAHSAASGAGTVAASGDASSVVAFARSQLGKPYVLGGAGPNVWDCSGLSMVAYGNIGVKLPHSALAQSHMGTRIYRKSDLIAGDLLFPSHVLGVGAVGDHVQIFSGNNTVIEAAHAGAPVREIALSHWWPGTYVYARRYVATSSAVVNPNQQRVTQPTRPGSAGTGTTRYPQGGHFG